MTEFPIARTIATNPQCTAVPDTVEIKFEFLETFQILVFKVTNKLIQY